MQNLTFEKAFILQRLKENRKTHKKIFNEAVVKYREEAVAALEERLEVARGDGEFDLHFNLPQPNHHLDEYDRMILMVEHCTEEVLELNEEEYGCLIMDNWQWQRSFMTSNKGYSMTAVSGCLDRGW